MNSFSEGAKSSSDQPDPDSIKMFVGQISRSATEEELRAMFEEFGTIHELTILTDPTGASKGCCFLRYHTREAALHAQKALNNVRKMPGMHNAIQMKPADSETKSMEDRKLFVGMLPRTFTDADVRDLFAGLGTIDECTVLRESDGTSKGCAFVVLATRQSAINAIRNLHHTRVLEGAKNPVVVKFADTQRDKDSRKKHDVPHHTSMGNGAGSMGGGGGGAYGPGGGSNTQYAQQMMQQAMSATGMMGGPSGATAGVNALQQQLLMTALMQMMQGKPGDASTNMAAMLAIMAAAGGNTGQMAPLLQQLLSTMSSANTGPQPPMNMPSYGNNNAPSVPPAGGYGMPNQASGGSMSAFDALAQAYSGMQQFNASSVGQQSSSASQASSMSGAIGSRQSEGPDGANLFIYHLPPEFNDNDLVQIFSPFGTIVSSKVFIDRATNTSKCFGFISYDNAAAAQAAIQAMNGFQMGTRRLKVQLKRPKNESKPY